VPLERALERSIVLAEELGLRESLLTALAGLWSCYFVRGDATAALKAAERTLAVADPESTLSAPAHFAFGGSSVSVGRPVEALRHLEHDSTLRSTHLLSIGTRPDVHGRAFAAHAHWLVGQDDQALRSCEAALALARTIERPYNLAVALGYAGILHQMRGDPNELRRHVTELRGLCDKYDFAYYREWALILDGWSRPDSAGIGLIQQGIANLRADGSFARMPYWLSLLADALARHGRSDAARATLDAAVARAHNDKDLWWLPEVLRMRAGFDTADATAIRRLSGAARLAADQGSVSLQRRCIADLATRGVAAP
jgi:tetratricopeptide (TPR) repeat protein